jgi:hypothetical protein
MSAPALSSGLEVIHGGIKIEFALDGMSRDGVRYLACGVLVFVGHIGQHATEERDIHSFPPVENGIYAFLNFLGCTACRRFFGFPLSFLAGFLRCGNDLVPTFMNGIG